MTIKLISTKAISIELNPEESDIDSKDKDVDFSFDFNPLFPSNEDKVNNFIVAFFGKLKSYKESFECKVVFVAHFESEQSIDKNFLTSNFALINAPAIGYPYFRSFISNLLLNSGYEPTILPTINFVNLKQEKTEEILSKQDN